MKEFAILAQINIFIKYSISTTYEVVGKMRISGFGKVEKNITFSRFWVMTEWHNCLSFNEMAGSL